MAWASQQQDVLCSHLALLFQCFPVYGCGELVSLAALPCTVHVNNLNWGLLFHYQLYQLGLTLCSLFGSCGRKHRRPEYKKEASMESWGRSNWNIKQFLQGNGLRGLVLCSQAKVRGTFTIRVCSGVMGMERLLSRWLEDFKVARKKGWIAEFPPTPFLFCGFFFFLIQRPHKY